MALNTLGESNEVTLRWITAHFGYEYEGHELTDQLENRCSNNERATMIKLPMPRYACYAALKRKTVVNCIESYKVNPPKIITFCGGTSFIRI